MAKRKSKTQKLEELFDTVETEISHMDDGMKTISLDPDQWEPVGEDGDEFQERTMIGEELEETVDIPLTDDCSEIFSNRDLKKDYMLVRRNLLRLVNSGQNILSAAAMSDLSDLKASQVMAFAQLQSAVGNNLKLLMETYQMITGVESERMKMRGEMLPEGTTINQQQNIIFKGSTADLMKHLNEKREDNDQR